jgi:hypothetical protein
VRANRVGVIGRRAARHTRGGSDTWRNLVNLKLAVGGGVVGRGPAAEALVMRLMRLDHHVVFFGRQSTKFKSVLGGNGREAGPLDFRRVYFEILLLGCLIPACFGTASREL